MYGLILQNIAEYIRVKFGDGKWKEIKESLKIEQDDFVFTEVFPEGQVAKIGKQAMKVLGLKDEEFYEGMGKYFVTLADNAGYKQTVVRLGRKVRDFFLNLDNLHDYLKLTFPKMKAPSFFIEEESGKSMNLQYRTRRRGFHYYVQGQIKELSKLIFMSTGRVTEKCEVKLKKQEIVFDTAVFHFELEFENGGYTQFLADIESRKEASMPIRATVFFEMFPFCILYEKEMVVKNMGTALRHCVPMMVGRKLTEFWELVKPLVDFKWEVIETRMNSMFELATQEEIDKLGDSTSNVSLSGSAELALDDDVDKTLHIKGQMLFVPEWDLMLFLACPIMKSLNDLVWSGLFVNDLSMHDYSRDILLANVQRGLDGKLAKMQVMKKIAKCEVAKKLSNEYKKDNEELGYAFLPSDVATGLITGKDPESMYTKVEHCSILVAMLENLAEVCSVAQPADVCNFMNNMNSVYNHLTKKNKGFHLDRVGYYMVESGASRADTAHAEHIADLALDIIEATKKAMKDPHDKKNVAQIGVGITSGPVTTGIGGKALKKFVLFGLPVEKSSALGSNAKPGQIIAGPLMVEEYLSKCKPEFKTDKGKDEVPGVGIPYVLKDRKDRKKLSDKDIKSAEEISKVEDDKGGDGDKAEAKGDGGGDAAPAAEGEAKSEDAGESEAAPASSGGGGGGSPASARPVSSVNQAQCCAGLKSGLCNLL